MRSRLVLLALFLAVVARPLGPARSRAAAPSPQAEWDTYVNAAYGWSMRYPAGWHVNQGDLGPLPAPITTKFSTYAASSGQKVALTAADAEVWVTVTDAALAAAAAATFGQSYAERKIEVAGLPATRYTAMQPAFGLYDAVILVAGERTYRIYLSASTHAFDAQFQSMLDSFALSAATEASGSYPQVAGAWVSGGADSQGPALELTQDGASLRGQLRFVDAAGAAVARPVTGSIGAGRTLRVQTSDAIVPAIEIDGTLSADGGSFSGTWKTGDAAALELSMTLAEPALPGTGADLSRAPASVGLALFATLLATCGAVRALGARKARP